MKMLTFALLLTFLQSVSPTNPNANLKAFIHDIIEAKLSDAQIGDKYFCTQMLHRTDQKGEDARRYLQFALSYQRSSLQKKQLKLDEVKFIPYDSLSANELPAKPFHMLSETKNVYVAWYSGEIICFFLLQNGKIASNLLINQGGENYFIDFCTGYPM
ncbi:MAG: hypothetical protein ACRYFV_08970 [Janthinobacterium lividum]